MNVNGKFYPLWGQFVERKGEFIGGTLEDHDPDIQRFHNKPFASTTITDIRLKPNGEDSAMFCVDGADFTCAGSVKFLGITAGEEGWITLAGYAGHPWRFKGPADKEPA
jgi:hypothetical protein